MKPWIDYTVLRGSFDISRARAELGFEVAFPLAAGIADYAEWLRGQLPVESRRAG